MSDYKVWFYDSDNDADYVVTVNANGIDDALVSAEMLCQNQYGDTYLRWTFWKIETI